MIRCLGTFYIEHLNFSDIHCSIKFIKWIQLFNTEINAHVIQCGFLSKPIQIMRGCHQGDPISAYLFLIGTKILTQMILTNSDIIGLKIEGIEFKLTVCE